MIQIITGDAREVLKAMEPESVQCVITSPPYWGLRDYGTATWEGGDPECDHAVKVSGGPKQLAGVGANGHAAKADRLTRTHCGKCGAARTDSQFGLEPSPQEYVAQMVELFREVWRVLRPDGTVWLNMGDSYAAQRSGTHQPAETLAGGKSGRTADGKRVNRDRHDGCNPSRNASGFGLKHKDLIGVPWRLALALQDDGWWLRSDIVWSKPNPMPESVMDRPTRAHEYIFLLSKSARYYYDADAVRTEAVAPTTKMPDGWDTGAGAHGSYHRNGREKGRKTDKQRGHRRRHAGFNDRWDSVSHEEQQATGANLRTVWTVATHPFPGAHFATFPPKLIEPCVKAGTKPGDLILDPFTGAGTTGLVASRLDRSFVGVELNPEYAEMARRRIYEDAPMLMAEAIEGFTPQQARFE